jgi:serine/threonine protein kinase
MDNYNNINIHNYIRETKLGQGSFSEVFLYKLLNKNQDKEKQIVVKTVLPKYFKYTKNELKFLTQINSYNNQYIIKLLGTQTLHYDTRLFFFENWGKNLYSFYKKKTYTSNQIIDISYQILKGIQFLHSIDIIHCDLKPENILIKKNEDNLLQIKIIDLGSCLEINKIKFDNFYICTRYYRAPELLYNLYFNEKIDIWSVGCIITELIMIKPLFPAKNESKLIEYINDLLGTPNLEEYIWSKIYKNNFINNDNNIKKFNEPFCFDIRFDKYLKHFNCNKIQIKNFKALFKSILNYNIFERLSATECLDNPIFLEHKLKLKLI